MISIHLEIGAPDPQEKLMHSTRNDSTNSCEYSVIIPLKDEEDNIIPLLEEVHSVLRCLSGAWEVICVDDGSTDATRQRLNAWQALHPELRILSFDRNYGQSSAFDAGFRAARGNIVITLDGDGQNDPQDLLNMVPLLHQYDLVCGIRKKRRDCWSKRWISKIANWVRSRICEDGVSDTGCSLKVYRRSCLQQIKLYHGMHRFLPALFVIEGFKVGEIPVHHRERQRGKSKYHLLNRSLNTVFDLFAVAWMKNRQLKYRVKEASSESGAAVH